jgi:hypothetical protein
LLCASIVADDAHAFTDAVHQFLLMLLCGHIICVSPRPVVVMSRIIKKKLLQVHQSLLLCADIANRSLAAN